MSDFNTDHDLITTLRGGIADRDGHIQRLTADRDKARQDLADTRNLMSDLQTALADWANSNLDTSRPDYQELSELMIEHGLDGLKRTFSVLVKVSYEFEVEVEAADDDAARDEVDNNITTYVHENVDLYGYPDDYEIAEVNEA